MCRLEQDCIARPKFTGSKRVSHCVAEPAISFQIVHLPRFILASRHAVGLLSCPKVLADSHQMSPLALPPFLLPFA